MHRWRQPRRQRNDSRSVDAVQVEVTTRCNHRCLMCPTSHCKPTVLLDLEWDAYARLASFFNRVRLVFLQGWGEPLLHPRFFDMVALAREHGCRTGFTTNGSLLDAQAAREVLRLTVGYVTVSLAGADARTHNRIRRGSDFEKLLNNVARLVEMKKSAGAREPRIHLSFMLKSDSVAELPKAVRLAHALGVDRLVAPNLDCPVVPEDEQNRIFDWGGPSPEHRAALAEARSLAETLGLAVSIHSLELNDDVLLCELNPLNQFYVNVHGEVSPCVYSSILGRKTWDRYFRGEKVPTEAVVFGSLADAEMADIWEAEDYRRFRDVFARRIGAFSELIRRPGEVRDALTLERFSRDLDRVLRENPLPAGCRTCYKAYGA